MKRIMDGDRKKFGNWGVGMANDASLKETENLVIGKSVNSMQNTMEEVNYKWKWKMKSISVWGIDSVNDVTIKNARNYTFCGKWYKFYIHG